MPNKTTFPTDFWEDTQNKLTFVISKTLPQKIAMTAVKCIIIRHDSILLTKIQRGWDIPTGHIEDGESPEEAVKREVFEETGTILQSSYLLGYLYSVKVKENERNKKYPKISTIPVFVGEKFVIRRKFEKKYEATDRNFFKLHKDGSIQSQNWSPLMKAIFSFVLTCKKTKAHAANP